MMSRRTILMINNNNSSASPNDNLVNTNSGSAWNMINNHHHLLLPQSPFLISSRSTTSLSSTLGSSSSSDTMSCSQFPQDHSSSTLREQRFGSGWDINHQDSKMELDVRTNHVNRFGGLFPSIIQHNHPQGTSSNFEEYLRRQGTSEGSPESLRDKLMGRPKPYSAFLDEVKKHEFEAEVGAWRRAKEEAILGSLRRKEALIIEWESKQTSKAMNEMKKYERKLDKKRAKALEKLESRIKLTKAEADKKSRKAKRETMKKMSEISEITIKARATNNLACLKL